MRIHKILTPIYQSTVVKIKTFSDKHHIHRLLTWNLILYASEPFDYVLAYRRLGDEYPFLLYYRTYVVSDNFADGLSIYDICDALFYYLMY